MRINPGDAQLNREMLLVSNQRRGTGSLGQVKLDESVMQRAQRVFDAATVRSRSTQPPSAAGAVTSNTYSGRVSSQSMNAERSPSPKPGREPVVAGRIDVPTSPKGDGERPRVPSEVDREAFRERADALGNSPTPRVGHVKPASADQGFTQADVDAVRSLFGAEAGDRRFNANYDLNEDGRIDATDLTTVLGLVGTGEPSPLGPPRDARGGAEASGPFTPADLDAVKASFGSSEGERRFNPNYDLNGDGVIDSSDLVKVLGMIEQPASSDGGGGSENTDRDAA